MSRDVLIDRILAEASVAGESEIFAVNCFSRRNISLVEQQLRAVNLAWAIRSRYEPKALRIAVIGAGMAGLTAALALRIGSAHAVSVFERHHTPLLPLFRVSNRYVHPHFNHLPADDYRWSTKKRSELPLLNWKADYAQIVAGRFLHNWRTYCEVWNIDLHRNVTVTADQVRKKSIPCIGHRPHDEMKFDLVVLATGLGEETRPDNLTFPHEYSYWQSGHPSTYARRHPDRRERILISGCGDSGIVEACHYAIQDFTQDAATRLMPFHENAPHIDEMVEGFLSSRCLDWIFYDEGPIDWYLKRRNDESLRRADDAPIYDHLDRHFKDTPDDLVEAKFWDTYDHARINELLALADEIDAGSAWHFFVETLQFDAGRHFAGLRLRDDFDVVMNGLLSRPFTNAASPKNQFVLAHLIRAGRISYIKGRIDRIDSHSTPMVVHFSDGRTEPFDRVCVRYGVDFRTLQFSSFQSGSSNPDVFKSNHLPIPEVMHYYRDIDGRLAFCENAFIYEDQSQAGSMQDMMSSARRGLVPTRTRLGTDISELLEEQWLKLVERRRRYFLSVPPKDHD
jgi:hypothetical protein